MNLKLLLLTTALILDLLVECVTPAFAADLAPKAPPPWPLATGSWAGWVLGVGVAGQWDTVNLPGVLNGGAASAKPSSVQIEGISLLNYEFGNRWVIMHKLEVGYSDPSIFGTDVQEWRIKTGPGVGYDFGPALFYVSGGAAAQATTFLGFRNPLVGYYIGPGLEFKPFGNDVVVGADVNYVDMSGANPFGSNSATSVEFGGHVAYHFH
jgi:hypothetical protein